MASSSAARLGDIRRYNKLNTEDHDFDLDLTTPVQDTITEVSNSRTNPSSTPIIRRRRPNPNSRPSPISAMSFVGLKRLFFQQTLTPVPSRKSNRDYGVQNASASSNFSGPFDWSHGSQEPLLRTDHSSQLLTSPCPTGVQQGVTQDSLSTDLESQSTDSKNEKANAKRSWRVDARVISDATIGLSDGLTVPFALTAGLSALGNTKVVVYGGFAELIAGAISMGLGGYLGAKSEAASYRAQREETEMLVATNPQTVIQDIAEVFQPFNVPKDTIDNLTRHLAESPQLVDFVMKFQHCEEEPASSRAFTSAITIALAYFLGGLLPLIPYFCTDQVYRGLYISIGVMVLALFTFGYVKTCVVVGWEGGKNIRAGCFGGVQMVVVGSAAAGAAMGLVRLFNHEEGGELGL